MTAITEFFENTKELKKIKESKNNSIWKNSKFEDFKDLSSRSKGAKAEKIVEEIMSHSYGHAVSKPLYDGDRSIDGYEVEIKASTCWEENIDSFTWQQIRSKQKYDRIIFVGINPNDKNWSSGDIFCLWANNIQSLIGFSLIASLYLVYDLNIIIVLASSLIAGTLVAVFANLIGQPSQKYGLPFPVILRSSFGVSGARYIGMLRGVVGIFMFGVQTFFISKSIGSFPK